MYIDGLMKGEPFAGKKGRQILRIDYDQNRKIVGVQKGGIGERVDWKDM